MAAENLNASQATKNVTEDSSLTTFDYAIESVASCLYNYYTPILIIFGWIGNILSSYVFCTSKLRMHSTRIYLSVLAVSDSLFLFQLLAPWMSAMQLTTFYHQYLYCQIVVYISYVSSCLSAWLVVAFTVERFVAVVYPLQRNVMCTVARAKCIVIILTFFAMLLNSPLILFASPSVNDCNINFDYMVHAAWFNLADTIVSFTVPFSIIVILNALIMIGVYRVNRARRVLQAQQATESELRAMRISRWNRACLPPLPPPPSAQHRITHMLLIVSTVFVGLNVPAYTMRILAYAYDMSTAEYTGRWAAAQQIALTFFNTNFGINFILYCLTGQNFRRALCQAIPCLRYAAHPNRRVNSLRLRTINTARPSIATICESAAETNNAVTESALISDATMERARRHHSEPAIQRWTCEIRPIQHQGVVRPSGMTEGGPAPREEMAGPSRSRGESEPTHRDATSCWDCCPMRERPRSGEGRSASIDMERPRRWTWKSSSRQVGQADRNDIDMSPSHRSGESRSAHPENMARFSRCTWNRQARRENIAGPSRRGGEGRPAHCDRDHLPSRNQQAGRDNVTGPLRWNQQVYNNDLAVPSTYQRTEEPRRIPYVLFPLRNIIVPRRRRSASPGVFD